jgi:predicted transcriptional regulator of viral defense system
MPRAEDIFTRHGGTLRMSEALRLGLTRRELYGLRDRGLIECVSRGVYRLTALPLISRPDLVTVGLRCPGAVVCLTSALAFHELTTQVPHAVSIAIPRPARAPTIDFPPVDVHRFSSAAYESGIETHIIDRVPVKVYSPAKTLADCFKFRNRVGMDVVLEALKLLGARDDAKVGELLRFAAVCRVEKVMRPYLEVTF